MNPETVLLILRLLSALILLGFLGAIVWLSYKDVRATTQLLDNPPQALGTLRVVASESEKPTTGSEFQLMPVTSIGRLANNTIVVEDEFASNEHALVSKRDRRWWLEDLGSRNGTFLNDLPISVATVITSGDVITVGRTYLRLELRINA